MEATISRICGGTHQKIQEKGDSSSPAFEEKGEFPSSKFIQVSVLPSGFLTLPEHFFCADQHDRSVRNTVPSMSFLIYHPSARRHIVFDLGMRRDLVSYPASIQPHLQTRQPIHTIPDTSESLKKGGLEPKDVDAVILSHVHYDHVGTPKDFSHAQFIVGHGTRDVLEHGMKYHSAAHFERDLLPADRIIALPIQADLPNYKGKVENSFPPTASLSIFVPGTFHSWQPLEHFPNAIDLFGDSLLYIIDSPGHLVGHLNVLARISENQWIYLAGDACHRGRILDGETNMATSEEGGQNMCIHSEKELAIETVRKIQKARKEGIDGASVEVVLAHDANWLKGHQDAIWPGKL
jgi:glyoxylase-like metal-dependent hydrolase (beta-lactamase superfamily II)